MLCVKLLDNGRQKAHRQCRQAGDPELAGPEVPDIVGSLFQRAEAGEVAVHFLEKGFRFRRWRRRAQDQRSAG